MKRAPIIPRTSSPVSKEPGNAPAAPMVDALISRVGVLTKGNTISLPVCGRDVKFTLETLDAGRVQKETRIWGGNERDQELLNESSLNDLIPSFLSSGQQNPALGRRVNGTIEVADGSRRRMAAICTNTQYRILVGDLDNEQMDALCRLGNDYRPTSAYERGKRYIRLLESKFNGNVSALAETENLSRISILRCMNTAKLPREVISLFAHPGELSARSGEQLASFFEKNESVLTANVRLLTQKKLSGELLEPEEIIRSLQSLSLMKTEQKPQSVRKKFAPGASAKYQGDKVIVSLEISKIPQDVITRIESILSELNVAGS
ncbi:ParB/RepB/Spo0J family plasmid partition protein [Cronobacter sakazakii]|nr:ParB/RepB/Spo0J family plasmid partition protein [Cronobacter sakazakii]ELY5804688.1 ParB/RepB/Spo0J family plasmid partition protein [Cronobacter sakazakii]ELY5855582.1 ParB/RepB/Spo0J family plasmid partition protein [Cronobacter malonaticus]